MSRNSARINNNRNVEWLSEALRQQLNLAEANLRQVIAEINREQPNPDTQNTTKEPEIETVHQAQRQRYRRRSRVLPYSRVRLGDTVQIINSSEHQQAEGEVIGATIGGYVRS